MTAPESQPMTRKLPKADFRLNQPFEPSGDQPKAIESLTQGIRSGQSAQVLLGATGTGKTFTMANVIAERGSSRLGAQSQQDTRRSAVQRIQ